MGVGWGGGWSVGAFSKQSKAGLTAGAVRPVRQMQVPPSLGAVPRDLVNEELPAHYVVDVLERRSTALWLRCKLMAPEALRPHGLIGKIFTASPPPGTILSDARILLSDGEPLCVSLPSDCSLCAKRLSVLGANRPCLRPVFSFRSWMLSPS